MKPGWAIATFDEITQINPRHSTELMDNLQVSFIPMPAISENIWMFKFMEERPLGEVRTGYTHFAEGDVLFAKITPCMENGKAAIASGLKNGLGCGTTELHVMRPLCGIDPMYIYQYIHQQSFRRDAASNFTGTAGQLRVPVTFIRKAEISIPPLNEQRRIVAKLEGLLGKVEACRVRLEKIPLLLKRFRQSVLAAACSGRLTADWREENPVIENTILSQISSDVDLPLIPETWNWARTDQVAEVKGGIQIQPKRAPRKNAYPYLRVANVLRNELDLSEVKKMELFENELEKYRLKANDLLIVEGNGSISEIGRSALWSGEIMDCVHQNHIIRVRCNKCDPKYINYYWNSPIGQDFVIKKAVTTAGLYSLSTKKVAELLVPFPPLPEQHEIVRRVERLFALADRIEARYQKAKTQVEKLTQSILAKAFRGELVPQDPADEPASVLLSRIRIETSVVKTTTFRRKK